MEITPKKTTPPSPDQPPLIPPEPEAPTGPIITREQADERQAARRKELDLEAEKPDHTDV
jgi:hypothetical protein